MDGIKMDDFRKLNIRNLCYAEAVSYIEEVPKFTKKAGLDHTVRILEVLGHPERSFHVIHVAGTNGKGSVCAYLNSMLIEGGYRCGMFTSPHLLRINERFQINGEEISDEVFTEAFKRVMEAVELTMAAGDTHPTYFEILFLMGMVIFREEEVEYCVLETGLGGRLDLTNVVEKPLACIITSISFDHMEYLGHSIPEIAGEKAGILKRNTPVIYDATSAEAAAVIAERANDLGIPSEAILPSQLELLSQAKSGISFRFERMDDKLRKVYELTISGVADYQMMNAALAFAAMIRLQKIHGIAEEVLLRAIAKTSWPCRMEMVRENIVIDGAHNADGIAALIRAASFFHQTQELTILFSAVSDKEYPYMIREIAEGLQPEHVITTKVGGSRSTSASAMAELFKEAGCRDVSYADEVGAAFDLARAKKGDGILFCVGSLYLAGELKGILKGENEHVKL